MDEVRSAARPVGQPEARDVAFLCQPYHRGGVTRWMVDAASEWVRRDQGRCWLVAPLPRSPFVNGAGRPTIVELAETLPSGVRPRIAAPVVGSEFEFGTCDYRARVLARALQQTLPAGVPIVVSDDPATWRGSSLVRGRHPLIGVLHGPDEPYMRLAEQYQGVAAAIVGVSPRVLNAARARVRTEEMATRVIPCGIPLPPAPPAPGHESSEIRVIWVGRITEREKRVSDLAAIAVELARAGRRFRLDIAGDGEDSGALRESVVRNELTQVVHFHGWLNHEAVTDLLARADVLLLPSNFEGMPVAAMEALARGCSVVASDTSGLDHYLDSPEAREALWIFPCGDVPGAARLVLRAAAVPPAQRRRAARRLAEQEFSIAICMDRYAALLSEIHQRRRTGPAAIASHAAADLASFAVAAARQLRLRVASKLARRATDGLPRSALMRA
ncbi:MAG TPA: glycosyltransferase family 4 protein [Gemmatimonadaceae bacterium]|nr:glycosyltransferase family 4 protein [Gemmatimonadaceae bacterium]